MTRLHDALLLDLDGTLLTSAEELHPRTRPALDAAREAGVRVMVVTGRSKIATLPILEQLELDSRSVLFNGAAVYCPREDRLTEERTLSGRTLRQLNEFAESTGDLTVWMNADRKLVRRSVGEAQRRSLEGLVGVEFVEFEDPLRPPVEHVIRMTFISDRHESSAAYAAELEASLRHPLYLTHFPLSVLPRHRSSEHHAVDVHAPCRGKAEALRVIEETYGIPPTRVVAVGDATNDLPMILAAGLGVAMGSGMRELRDAADRVIGDCDGPAVAELIEDLFL